MVPLYMHALQSMTQGGMNFLVSLSVTMHNLIKKSVKLEQYSMLFTNETKGLKERIQPKLAPEQLPLMRKLSNYKSHIVLLHKLY